MNIVRNSWRDRERGLSVYRTTLVVEDEVFSVEDFISDLVTYQHRESNYLVQMWGQQRFAIMKKLEERLFDKEHLL